MGIAVNLPFFAYGTLLPGQANYYLWQDAVAERRDASISGASLYDLGYYPMLVEEGRGVVHGMLLTVRPERYSQLIGVIDGLEGYDPDGAGPFAYTRLVRPVEAGLDEPVKAWVYVGDAGYLNGARRIHSGNWLEHSSSSRQRLESWWRGVETVSGVHGSTS